MLKFYVEKIIVTPHLEYKNLYTIYLNDEVYCHCSPKYLSSCIEGILKNSQKENKDR